MFCANRNLNFFEGVASDESTRSYFLADGSAEDFCQAVRNIASNWDIQGWDLATAEQAMLELIALFRDGSQSLQPLDTPYHDLRHTLQVVLCWCRMVDRLLAVESPAPIQGRLLQLGFYAALYHDSGYLKDRCDTSGTGAKLAAIHERRSCSIACRQLMDLLADDTQARALQRMIVATGPRVLMDAIPFSCEQERQLAQILASADFLAQLGDPDYPARLSWLYREMCEAESVRRFPRALPQLKDVDAFRAATPPFWSNFVWPHLQGACASVHRFLNDPYPGGKNPYLQAVERNLMVVAGYSPATDETI